MKIRSLATAAAIAASFVTASISPAFAAAPTTTATVAAKAAPATTAAAVTTKAVAATPTANKTAKGTKTPKPVIAGNFCKKKLVGTTSNNAAGVVLTCKADAKGKLRWTK